MNYLLKLSAVIELTAGLALLAVPAAVVRLLLANQISGAAVPLGRLAGVALFALGVACWLAGYDAPSRAARGLVAALLLYNLGAVLVLGAAGIWSQPVGIVLWPAVILHAAMAVWCGTQFKPDKI
jgi:hypothetical protein